MSSPFPQAFPRQIEFVGDTDKHPNRALLTEYGLGKLAPAEAARLEEHITDCQSCCDTLLAVENDTFVDSVRDASGFCSHNADSLSQSQLGRPNEGEIGDFRIIREIGRGGMGIVYEAEQISLSRRVVLKVISANGQSNATFVQRFLREAQAAARLHHPSIVPVFEVGTSENLHFYAMQYIEGATLEAIVADLRELRESQTMGSDAATQPSAVATQQASVTDECADMFSESTADTNDGPRASYIAGLEKKSARDFHAEVARIFSDAAEALHYVHRHGVVHRDIKPSNLMIDTQGRVWIVDFGLARVDESNLTGTNDVLGTLRYMPPEVYQGEVTPQSDLFGLGLAMFELIALRPAYDAMERKSLIRQVTSGDIRSIGEITDVPRDLETIVMKLLRMEPNDRYASGAEVHVDLRHFIAGQPIRARPIGAIERAWRWCKRNKLAAQMAATSCLLLLVIAVVSVLGLVSVRRKSAAIQRNLYAAQMVDASRAISTEAGLKRIDRTVEQWRDASDLLGWEWNYLNSLSKRDAGTLSGHTGTVYSVSWNENGDRLLSGGQDGKTNLWDAAKKEIIESFEDHSGSVRAAFWSPDYSKLATGANDGDIVVRDAKTFDVLTRLSYGSPLNTFAWSPDCKSIAAGYVDNQIVIWDTTSQKKRSLSGHMHPVIQVAWHPNGEELISCAIHEPRLLEHAFRIWNVAKCTSTIVPSKSEERVFHADSVYALAFSPSGRIISAGNKGRICIWNERGELLREGLRDHNGLIQCGIWNGTDQLITASQDRTVRVWDANDGRCTHTFRGHQGSVHWVSKHPKLPIIASASEDGSIKLWKLNAKPSPIVMRGRRGFSWAPDSKRYVSCEIEDLSLVIENISDDRQSLISISEVGNDTKVAVDFAPDGKTLATVVNGIVRIRDTESSSVRTFPIDPQLLPASWISWSPDMKRLLLTNSGNKNGIQIYDAESGQRLLKINGRTTGYAASWSPDGESVAGISFLSNDADVDSPDPRRRRLGSVAIWDSHSGEVIWQLPATATNGLAWHPSGNLIATAGDGEAIEIWNVSKRSKVNELAGHRGLLYAVAWSPDGSRLVATDANSNIKIWAPEHELELLSLDLSSDGIPIYLEWSPDGCKLALWSWDNHLHIFDATRGF